MATYRLTEGTLVIGTADADTDVAGRIAITTETATPAQPTDGRGYLYSKSDGKLYWRSYDITETDLTAGGGSGAVSSVANGADNRIATFSGTDSLNGEANLTFDGSTLVVTGDATISAGSITFGEGQNATITIASTDHNVAGKNFTIQASNPVAGTTNNIAGGALYLEAGRGKGSAAGGNVELRTSKAGSSGSSLNSSATFISISGADERIVFHEQSRMNAQKKLQFNDAGTYIYSSTDGQLDIVADGTVAVAGAATFSSNVTVSGDVILNDGGSIKEAGGTAAITIDAAGQVTKIGQDSPSSGEYLKWDGSKAVWAAVSASAKVAYQGYGSCQTSEILVNWNDLTTKGVGSQMTWLIMPFDGSVSSIILTMKASAAPDASNNGDITVKIYKNQANLASATTTTTFAASTFSELINNIDGAGADAYKKVITPSLTFSGGDLLQFTFEKTAGTGKGVLITLLLEES